MTNIKLKNINFGNNDGKNEAAISNFKDLFFNYENIYEKSLKPEIFLILGRKGSGKTTLIKYIIKNKESQDVFCRVDSYESFRLNQIINLKENSNYDEYQNVWEWTILVELSKLIILNKEYLISSNEMIILEKFISDNNFHLKLGGNKTIIKTSEEGVKGSLKSEINLEAGNNLWGKFKLAFQGLTSREEKMVIQTEKGKYYNYLSDLKKIIVSILEQNKNKEFILVYDELDGSFSDEPEYKKVIVGLLRVIECLNNELRERELKVKFFISLRKDILEIISYPNLSKILSDSTLELSWGRNIDGSSPLVELIAKKIKATNPQSYEGKTSLDIFRSIFIKPKIKNGIGKTTIQKHILKKTLLRPRDIVFFFNSLKNAYGEREKITEDMVYSAEKEYSDYFLKELKSELCGHFLEEEISQVIEILSSINKRYFYWDNILEKSRELEFSLEEKKLKIIFKKLFNLGFIGNQTSNLSQEKDEIKRYSWSYLHPGSKIDFSKELALHYGLYKVFGLI